MAHSHKTYKKRSIILPDAEHDTTECSEVIDDNEKEPYENVQTDKKYQAQQGSAFPHNDNPVTVNLVKLETPMKFTPSPTCSMLATDEYSGPYGFEIQVDKKFSGKNWVYSSDLNKLFINMNTPFHLHFKCNYFPSEHYVRALPVYCDSGSFQEPVLRCLHHRCLDDPDNEGLSNETIHHIMRIDHSLALYDCDEDSERRSVRLALDHPQAGTDWVPIAFKFMCQNSCISGMNRRPIQVIFTLEDIRQNVLGRHTMKVRICSCPKRDKQREEEDLKKCGSTVEIEKQIASPRISLDKPTAKLRRVDGFIQIPVLSLEDMLDVTDYARSRLLRKLRIEKRDPEEKEEALLKKYTMDLNAYE